jgi:ribosomal protein S18 acetylase RimI-like enzyme
MADIQRLSELDPADLVRIATGYSSTQQYRVDYRDTHDEVSFGLRLESIGKTYIRQYRFEEQDFREHQRLLGYGYSLGAFDEAALVGVILAEPQTWNRSMWVREFHVAVTHQRRGIGRELLRNVITRSRQDGFRTVVCETQTTNTPAIAFYRRMGFTLEGVDISLYTNQDYPDGEIAVFMKKRLA